MTRLDENALLRSQLAELEVSLQALKEENAMLRDQCAFNNDEAARIYDFARDKGAALERAAVVSYLRSQVAAYLAPIWANEIECGAHRREEEA